MRTPPVVWQKENKMAASRCKQTAVSERQVISRLRLTEIHQLCKDLGFKPGKRKKAQLVEEIIDARRVQNAENICPSISVQSEELDFENVSYNLNPTISQVPPVKFLHVYEHIVENSGRNKKCLDRGIKHFDETDIQDLACSEVSCTEIWFRAKCLASQKQKRYTVYAAIDRISGGCSSGKCECPQGLPGNCSHVAGLLFALEYINRTNQQNPGDISCTSQLCKWRKPRAMKVTPKPFKEIAIYKPKYGKEVKKLNRSDNDPRLSTDRTPDMDRIGSYLKELIAVFPDTGAQHYWNFPVETPEVIAEVEIDQCELDRAAESLIISQLQSASKTDVNSYIEEQRISAELQRHIEEITRQQSACPLWSHLHKGRLTSSLFGDVFSSSSSSSSKSLLNRIMGYTKLQRLPWTMRWGKEREYEAIEAYKKTMESRGTSVIVTRTGLTLSCDRSFLGASSDGRVFDDSQHEGLKHGALEVKCPCSLDGNDIRDKPLKDVASSKNFYMRIGSDGELRLKTSSKYYCQIQGEMAIMDVAWVDLVVWNRVDIQIQRIFFDVEFWESELYPKLLEFYKLKLVPEILGHID